MSQENTRIVTVISKGRAVPITSCKSIIMDEIGPDLTDVQLEYLSERASAEVPFPTASMRERCFNFSGSFQQTITPEVIAKGSLMATLCGNKVPNYIIKSLREMQESFGVESESILKLADDMSTFNKYSFEEALNKINPRWFEPISIEFGITSEMFNRRYRRKKKLRAKQGKRRKRQIEALSYRKGGHFEN